MQFPLFRSERPVYAVRKPDNHIQKFTFPCTLIISYSCLDHMSGAVKLMVVHQVRPPLIETINNIIGIQIPVRLLCRRDDIDRLVRRTLQFFILVPG